MSKPVTYKVTDAVNCLCVGATYSVQKDGRMWSFINVKTGVQIHLYSHEIEHAIARGKLVQLDETQSERMHCEAVSKLCHMLASHYIF